MSYEKIKVFECLLEDAILTTGFNKNYSITGLFRTKEKAIQYLSDDMSLEDCIKNFKNSFKIENENVYGRVKVYSMFIETDDLFDAVKNGEDCVSVEIIESSQEWMEICTEEEWNEHTKEEQEENEDESEEEEENEEEYENDEEEGNEEEENNEDEEDEEYNEYEEDEEEEEDDEGEDESDGENDEQKEGTIVLKGFFSDKKYSIVKAIRIINPTLGLRETNIMVDSVENGPVDILKFYSKNQAETYLSQLREAGADVEVKYS